MTDDFEDRLRRHLTDRADAVQAVPDPTAFVDHSVGPSRRRRLVAGGVAGLTVVAAGVGVLAGVNLAGAGATAQSAPTTTLPGRVGAALAPAGPGSSVPPSIVVQTPYTLLFTRVSPAGVTVRAYSTGTAAGACSPPGGCPPTTTVPTTTVPTTTVPVAPPCPANAMCAEPLVTPRATVGTAGSGGGTAGSGPVSTVAPPTTTGGTGATGSSPPGSSAACGQLVVELSTDRAVGTGSVAQPVSGATPGTVQILGSGSFGSAEGAPVSWVAVWAGAGVGSVQLSVGGTVVDAMTPTNGIAVLALPGDAGLTGASVTGLDPAGAGLNTVPATQGVQPAGADGCPVPTVTPSTTPTTAVPTGLPPTPTPTTTTTTAPAVAVPGPNQPVTPPGG